jgi:hypothetical protein
MVRTLWEGKWLVLALAFAAVFFWRAKWSQAARRVAVDALDALRGLVPPLAVVLVAGAFTTPEPLIQVAVGVLLGTILAHWAYSRDWKAFKLRDDGRRRLVIHADQEFQTPGWIGVGAAGAIALIVVLALLLGLPSYEDRGGTSATFALAALVVLAIALIARLLGFALGSSTWRMLPLALALLLVLRALTAIGIPFTWAGGSFPSVGLLLAILGFGFAFGVAGEAYAQRNEGPAPSTPLSKAAAFGLGASLLSAVLIFIALGAGAFEINTRAATSTRGLAKAAVVTDTYAEWSDRSLALAFLPVLRFDKRARWTPEFTDDYVRRATLTDVRAPDRKATAADLVAPCDRGRADPCRTLTIGCPRADRDDGKPCSKERAATPERGPRQDGGVYVRVARKGDTRGDEPDPFESFGPEDLRGRLTTLVQYWFFYDYDEWVAPVVAGRLVQRHEGDWEAVTVGLAAQEPLFVGFSEHCGGIWQRWGKRLSLARPTDTEFARTVGFRTDLGYEDAAPTGGPRSWAQASGLATHPVVQVAVGSQANYPPRLSSRAPDWSTCQGVPRQAVALLSYVSNLRDRTGTDLTWLPSDIALVDRTTPPMTFAGTWGAKDSMQFVTTHDDPDAKGGRGPATPTRQPLWQRPVFQIFCSVGWRGDREDRNPSCPG